MEEIEIETSNLLVGGCARDGYDGLIRQFGAS